MEFDETNSINVSVFLVNCILLVAFAAILYIWLSRGRGIEQGQGNDLKAEDSSQVTKRLEECSATDKETDDRKAEEKNKLRKRQKIEAAPTGKEKTDDGISETSDNMKKQATVVFRKVE